MADPLSISLAVITLGTALKDLTELALKLHNSFTKPRRNMRHAQSLAAETLEIVQDLDKYYQSHRGALDNMPEVRDAVVALSKDMRSVYNKCSPFFQIEPSQTGLRQTIVLIDLWLKRKELELNIRNLKEQANRCYRRFTRHAQLGTVVAIGELKGAVSEGFSATGRQLSSLQVSDENVLAFMGSTHAVLSTLPPGVMLSEDLVFKLYVRGHVGKIDNILKELALERSYAVGRRHKAVSLNIETCFALSALADVEYVRGHTVTNLIRMQQRLLNIKAGVCPMQEGAWALDTLSVDLSRLRMRSESIILRTWSADLFRTLMKTRRKVYAPHLAFVLSELTRSFYYGGDLTQAISTSKECLSLLKTCAPTFTMKVLMAQVLSDLACTRRATGEHPSAWLQDAQDSITIFECIGAGQMTITGPVRGGNDVVFSGISGRDDALAEYAIALDEQRKFLYDSRRYQESLDAAKRSLALYRALAQCYKEVDHQSRIGRLCIFLCDDVFRDVISLSSALTYAEEAVRTWQKVDETTRDQAENISYSLSMQAKILVKMGRRDALEVFQELARRVRCMTTNLQWHIEKLQDVSSSLYQQGHFAEAATTSRAVVEISRQSAETLLPISRVEILLHHAIHCEPVGCMSEGLVSSQEALVVTGQQRMKDAASTEQYLFCVGWAVYFLLEAGYPEEAIRQCQHAINVIPSLSGYGSTVVLDIISTKALAYLRLGRLSLAAETISKGYDFADSTTLDLRHDPWYGQLLSVAALVKRCEGDQDNALAAIKAAISIKSVNLRSQLCALSDVQADMGHDAEGLRTAEGLLPRDCQTASLNIDQHQYRSSQYTLCLRLFYSGNLTQARQLILEVRCFYEWHAHSHKAWFIELARALRAEGILECASDRHAEGAVARTRLNELQ
ncbi:hypothetical protein D9613_010422 [Agrocybe pediades]|uniref:Uncharacterized protein n=1 Tax=Agrocybe pediades TaxID=84607 RepID=A0A8H4VI18_9AGAR|nr:hypothetical protein D9613_010422 [Agrocybe pediades]